MRTKVVWVAMGLVWAAGMAQGWLAGTPKLRLSVAPGAQGVVRGEHRLEACATERGEAALGIVPRHETHGTDGTGADRVVCPRGASSCEPQAACRETSGSLLSRVTRHASRPRVTHQEEGEVEWVRAVAAGTPKLRLSVAPRAWGVVWGDGTHGTNGTDGTGADLITRHRGASSHELRAASQEGRGGRACRRRHPVRSSHASRVTRQEGGGDAWGAGGSRGRVRPSESITIAVSGGSTPVAPFFF